MKEIRAKEEGKHTPLSTLRSLKGLFTDDENNKKVVIVEKLFPKFDLQYTNAAIILCENVYYALRMNRLQIKYQELTGQLIQYNKYRNCFKQTKLLQEIAS